MAIENETLAVKILAVGIDRSGLNYYLNYYLNYSRFSTKILVLLSIILTISA
jgi:hypothetical protein